MSENKEILLSFLNTYIPIITLIAFILLVLVFVLYIYKIKTKKDSKILSFLSSHALLFGFLLTLFGTVMSLIYSDFLGQAPCGLCWFQRIFLYSQLVLFIVAYLKNDINVFSYTIWLSVAGAIIALYHEYLQLGFNENLPCPVTPGFIDCAEPLFLYFGFVTFPFTSLTSFLFLILLAALVKNSKTH